MSATCQSCSMTIESGEFCQHCTDETGGLLEFEEIASRFDQWTAKKNPDKSADELRAMTLSFMATMPAWQDHPDVKKAQA